MKSRYVKSSINRIFFYFEQQIMTIISISNYFEIYEIRYSKSQLSIQNVYALIVHKIQFLTLNDIAVSLNSTMFARKHAYIAMNKTQKFKQIEIISFCRKTFKIDKKTIKKYERLKKNTMI